MFEEPNTVDGGARQAGAGLETRSGNQQVLHSFQELPLSVGQVSSGPCGAVSRKDHVSWRSKPLTDPAHWCGRLDYVMGNRVGPKPLYNVMICLGVGIILGALVRKD
jgi:hypothetical protein